MMDKRQEHLGDYNRNFACFLPAISNFFQTFVTKQRLTDGKHIPADRLPKGLDRGVEGLNFINPVSYTHLTLPTIYSV